MRFLSQETFESTGKTNPEYWPELAWISNKFSP